jgi:hypothetical protein
MAASHGALCVTVGVVVRLSNYFSTPGPGLPRPARWPSTSKAPNGEGRPRLRPRRPGPRLNCAGTTPARRPGNLCGKGGAGQQAFVETGEHGDCTGPSAVHVDDHPARASGYVRPPHTGQVGTDQARPRPRQLVRSVRRVGPGTRRSLAMMKSSMTEGQNTTSGRSSKPVRRAKTPRRLAANNSVGLSSGTGPTPLSASRQSGARSAEHTQTASWPAPGSLGRPWPPPSRVYSFDGVTPATSVLRTRNGSLTRLPRSFWYQLPGWFGNGSIFASLPGPQTLSRAWSLPS